MKFLVVAAFMCLALVGHTQGGSLRGLIVPQQTYGVPHQTYGVPLPDSHIGEIKPIEQIPFVGSLPLVDSVVSFGDVSTTTEHYIESTTAKPELPFLQPGLPALPAAPIVPLNIEKPVEIQHSIEVNSQLSNAYLPPQPGVQLSIPTLPAAPIVPLVIQHPSQVSAHISNAYLPPKPESVTEAPKPELPYLKPGLPALPAAPIIPVTTQQPIQAIAVVSNTYLPPQPEPQINQPAVSNAYLPPKPEAVTEAPKPELPYLKPGLPALPAAPIIPLTIQQPIQVSPTVSNTYLPPKPEPEVILPAPVETPKPELPYLPPGLPTLPAAPIVPLTPLVIHDQKPSEIYLPSSINNIPLPTISEIPALPAAPLSFAGYNYERPLVQKRPNHQNHEMRHPGFGSSPLSGAVTTSTPIIEQVTPGYVYEHPKISEIPALPEAPVTPSTPIVEEVKPGYSYEPPVSSVEPTAAVVEEGYSYPVPKPTLNIPVVEGSQWASSSGFISRPVNQVHLASVSSHVIGSHIQPVLVHQPAQQIVSVSHIQPTHQVLVQPAIQLIPQQPQLIVDPVKEVPSSGYSYDPPQIPFKTPTSA